MNRRDGLISVIDALHAEIAAMKANDVSALDRATQTKLVAIDALAAIDGADEVHGYRLGLATCERIAARLAALPVDERRKVDGLHPDRAPTIVAGAVILTESIRALGLDQVEVSDRDILHGAVLTA